MRSAIKEDEWMLHAHGAIMGFRGTPPSGDLRAEEPRERRHRLVCLDQRLGEAGWDPSRSPALWDEAAEALPGMVRITARAWTRSAWTLGAGVRSSKLLARALTDPTTAGLLVQEVARDVAEASRAVSDVARAVSAGVPIPKALLDATARCRRWCCPTPLRGSRRLRSRPCASAARRCCSDHVTCGATTRTPIRRTPDPGRPGPGRGPHPAPAAPWGPQPSVDVRTGGPVGMGELGPRRARHVDDRRSGPGCRYLDEVPAYLNNLFRLGLIWFSREQIEDPMEYQVVEAQPDVLAAMHLVRFPKVVRRSIHHPGAGFCKACLVDPEETDELPAHQIPEE